MLTAIVSAGFVLACVAPLLARMSRGFGGWVCAVVPAGVALSLLILMPSISAGQVVAESRPWAPLLGIALSFRLDGLALLFALLISGIGACVFVYAGAYMHSDSERGRLLAYLSMFMGAMLGLVLADNVLTLFVFWELTSIASYLLIGFDHHRAAARSAALQALLVTGAGGLALLAGLLMLADAGGSYELSELLTRGESIASDPLAGALTLCILVGAFAKSAQVPFHFWLPNAMEAPTPVSAYLHSSTMVKAGVYLVARLMPAFDQVPLWTTLLMSIGALTMVTGAVMAWRQVDLKRILAFSTVSSLGTLILLLGINTPASLIAAVVFVLAHALYKGALFLTAGIVIHQSGEGAVTRLAGLRRVMPLTAGAAAVAALSMAGLPPFFGFVAKELLIEVSLPEADAGMLTLAAVVVSAVLTAVVAVRVGLQPYAGRRSERLEHVDEGSPGLWLGAVILAGLGATLGLAPQLVAGSLIGPAASAMAGEHVPVTLAIWHGLTPAIGVSAFVLLAAALVYWKHARLEWITAMKAPVWLTPSAWYEAAITGTTALAVMQTRLLQSGYLRSYVGVTILATGVATAWALVRPMWPALPWGPGPVWEGDAHAAEIVLAALILAAAVAAARSQSLLASVALLGGVGYGLALLFAIHGAPDLAMTQFVVEALVVVLFVLVVHRLPVLRVGSSRVDRWRSMAVAAAAGLLMTTLVLASSQVEVPERVSTYFDERSVPDAHGRNVVNVILVDFRALDTLGEIVVLALAGLGVHALIRLKPRAGRGQ